MTSSVIHPANIGVDDYLQWSVLNKCSLTQMDHFFVQKSEAHALITGNALVELSTLLALYALYYTVLIFIPLVFFIT